MTDPIKLRWRKASSSASNGSCVEFAEDAGAVLLRDSKDPEGPILVFDRPAIADLLARVRRGEFDDLT